MKKKLLAFFILAALAGNHLNAQNKIVLDVSNVKYTINKNIYCSFSEHLGKCIYGGFYVGENNKYPVFLL